MNITQKKYALNRLDQIRDIKLREIADEKHKISREWDFKRDKTNEYQLKLQYIKDGKAKLKPNFGLNDYVLNIFDFSHLPFPKPEFLDFSRFDQMEKKVKKKCQELKDKIMLGTESEALQAMKEMEKFKV